MELAALLEDPPQERTLKRQISILVEKGDIVVLGKGPSTRYALSAQAQLTMPLNLDSYFAKEIDERIVQEGFNF